MVVTRSGELQCPVLGLIGEVDIATVPIVRDAIDAALAQGARALTIDLTSVNFVDSAGLGLLVAYHRRLRDERGTGIVVSGVRSPVRRVFEITGLDSLLARDD